MSLFICIHVFSDDPWAYSHRRPHIILDRSGEVQVIAMVINLIHDCVSNHCQDYRRKLVGLCMRIAIVTSIPPLRS